MFLRLSAFSREFLQYNLKASGIAELDQYGKTLYFVPGESNPILASQEMFLLERVFREYFRNKLTSACPI